MGTRRKNFLVVISLPLTVAALMAGASPAAANPLLSGYGGPGQGEQAVIGATLLNTPRGGGSSGGSGSSGEPSGASLTVTTGTTKSAGSAKPNGRTHHSAGPRESAAKSPSSVTASPSAALAGGLRDAAATTSSGGTLGLSGADLLYLFLALAALALAAGLTRQLARRPQ